MEDKDKVGMRKVEEAIGLLQEIKDISEKNRELIKESVSDMKKEISSFLDSAAEDMEKIKENNAAALERVSDLIEGKGSEFARKIEKLSRENETKTAEAGIAIRKEAEKFLDEKIQNLAVDFKETIKDMEDLVREVSHAVKKKECRQHRDNLTRMMVRLTAAKNRPPQSGPDKRWSLET